MADWFNKLSPAAKKSYLAKHPNSIYGKKAGRRKPTATTKKEIVKKVAGARSRYAGKTAKTAAHATAWQLAEKIKHLKLDIEDAQKQLRNAVSNLRNSKSATDRSNKLQRKEKAGEKLFKLQKQLARLTKKK